MSRLYVQRVPSPRSPSCCTAMFQPQPRMDKPNSVTFSAWAGVDNVSRSRRRRSLSLLLHHPLPTYTHTHTHTHYALALLQMALERANHVFSSTTVALQHAWYTGEASVGCNLLTSPLETARSNTLHLLMQEISHITFFTYSHINESIYHRSATISRSIEK